MRNYKKKTARGEISKGIILRAIAEIKNGTYKNASQAAKHLSIPKRSLSRWYKQYISSELSCEKPTISAGYNKSTMVFNVNQELDLVKYHVTASDSPTDTRKLAYCFAMEQNIKVPESWHRNKQAGADWFSGFLKRHTLSIKKPKATPVARSTSPNSDLSEVAHKVVAPAVSLISESVSASINRVYSPAFFRFIRSQTLIK